MVFFAFVFFIYLCSVVTPLKALRTVSKIDGKKRVVIVGGGVGGLAVASRIAASSSRSKSNDSRNDDDSVVEVLLLEKNSEEMAGGRCGSFDRVIKGKGTFRHERGPSLLLLKDEYEKLFTDCGSTSEQHDLKFAQCVPAYQVVFDDGDTVELGFPGGRADSKCNRESLSREKLDSFEKDGATKWDEYMKASSAFLDCGLPNFIEERLDLASFPEFVYQALRQGGKCWPLKPHSDVLDAIFDSEKMKCLASFQDLYVGLEPYRNNKQFGGGVIKKTAPAVFSLLAALELHPDNKRSGVFAPIGGFRAVSQAFLSLAKENGVKIEFNAAVTGVSDTGVYCKKAHSSDKSPETKGSVEDTFVEADLVIINADVPYAAKSLISSSDAPVKTKLTEKIDWDDSYDYSSGVIAFHWSVDKRLDGLNTHNVFLSAKNRSDAEQSWNALRRDAKQRPIKDQAFSFENMDPFNFYVHRAPQTDPTASPDDCDSIMVLVPTDVLVREDANAKLPKAIAIEKYKAQFSDDFIDTVKKSVLTRLSVIESLAGLKNHILDEVVDTPASYADMYNLGAGATFGLSHGFGQLSLTRPSAAFFEKSHKNIMCVGASSRPGNGVPLVLIGAKSVAQMAIERLK